MKFDNWSISSNKCYDRLAQPVRWAWLSPILDLARRHFVSISADWGVLMHKFKVLLAPVWKCAIWPVVVRAELASPRFICLYCSHAWRCMLMLNLALRLKSDLNLIQRSWISSRKSDFRLRRITVGRTVALLECSLPQEPYVWMTLYRAGGHPLLHVLDLAAKRPGPPHSRVSFTVCLKINFVCQLTQFVEL